MKGNNYYFECYYLVSGKIERGMFYMVVMFEDKLVYDLYFFRVGLI